jgi:polyphosphate kinase
MGNRVVCSYCFRITRDSDLEMHEEETEDLLDEVERSLKDRKWGDPVRLEIERSMSKPLRKFLARTLELGESDVYEIPGPLDLTFLMPFVSSKCPERLKNAYIPPKASPAFIGTDVFGRLKEGDVLVHHPYESFDAVLNFVRAAAKDKNVLAIKQTLYRVSGDSPVVKALIEAAENGKQVTVLVELKARFDEENNIQWAKKLEQSGCHVVYGLVGYKIHCKMFLAVRREDDGIRRYVHLGTGNYNDSTARLYTDLGFFTCKEQYCADVSALFNVLTGYSDYTRFNKLIAAPKDMRSGMIDLIDAEIKNASRGMPSGITVKMNSLVDPDVIAALYRASIAGVKINLIIRGICCLRPGMPGVSDNITVSSIVDRYLEHSRIYYFENGGEPLVYLASADWMQRNFDRRVEVAFPVEDPELKSRIKQILGTVLSDTVKLRRLDADGSYSRVDRRGRELVHSQLELHKKP